MIKFLVKAFIVAVAAVISYQYLIIYQTEDVTEVDHFEQVGRGIGKTLKVTSEIPGQVRESEGYQTLKQSIKEELKDTVR
jgi:hypothetical protein